MDTKKAVIILIVFLFIGCSKKVIEDTTPKFETAVITAEVHNSGIKGLFGYDGEEIAHTREDRKQTRHKMKFSGAVMRFVSSGSDQSTIQRVDKNLLWDINNKDRRYTECPLGGCIPEPGQFSFSSLMAPPKEGEEPPLDPTASAQDEPQMDKNCESKVVENSFDVMKTGQTKRINTFPTEEYQMQWKLVVEDDKKRQSKNTIQVNLWTTTITGDIQKALDMDRTFQQNYTQKLKQQRPELASVLPMEAVSALTTYFFNTIPVDQREKMLNISKKLSKIQGYPISTKLEWNVSGNACEAEVSATTQKEQDRDIDISGGVSGVMGSLTGMFVKSQVDKETQKAQAKPLFSYVREVKSIGMNSVHDSIMNVPHGYALDTRK